MQLSTFTKVPSVPREQNYNDFPVIVRVKAPEMTVHLLAPVDIVAVIDVRESMGWDISRLNVVKKAMAKVIENLGAAGAENRLSIVAFNHEVTVATALAEMTERGKKSASKTVDELQPDGGTSFSVALEKAKQILDGREAKDRLAFIIFLSDGSDNFFYKEQVPKAYPIHTFGISNDHSATTLKAMARLSSGSYTSITDEDLDKITEELDQLSDKLSSIVGVDMSINLKSLHPGVSLSRIGPSEAHDGSKSEIGDDKQTATIFVGCVSSGKESEFTVYLNVPEGQGNGTEGAMDVLMVGGSYKQSWDQKLITLDESVVTVKRPSLTSSCKELDLIEERVKYWSKVKLDLSEMSDKAEAEAGVIKVSGGNGEESNCQCQVLQALREASMEGINKAMHHDIYTATMLAIMLRHCGCGGKTTPAITTENVPSMPAQPTKAV
nr:unnamed protein product [Digitaria exilis]